MHRPGPVRNGEDVVPRPVEPLVTHCRAALARHDQADGVPGGALAARGFFDALVKEVERRHDGTAVTRITIRARAILAARGTRDIPARIRAREAVFGRFLAAHLPEALVLP